MAAPRKITAWTMKPVDDQKISVMRANLAIQWESGGGGPFAETIRTEETQYQGTPKTVTYIDWEETDAA